MSLIDPVRSKSIAERRRVLYWLLGVSAVFVVGLWLHSVVSIFRGPDDRVSVFEYVSGELSRARSDQSFGDAVNRNNMLDLLRDVNGDAADVSERDTDQHEGVGGEPNTFDESTYFESQQPGDSGGRGRLPL
jgi:hypothetical protein